MNYIFNNFELMGSTAVCKICSEREEEKNKITNDVSLSRQYSTSLLKSQIIRENLNEKVLKHKIIEGFGKIEYKNQSTFTGYIHDNNANGWGIYYHPLNGEYKGEYLNDQPNGYGIYNHITNSTYEGLWKNEKQNGIGIEKWKDNSIYKGEFENGKKKGIGGYFFPNGRIYFGEWDENLMNGFGIYYYNNGDIYFGEWKNGIKNGYGEIYLKNNMFFLGFYQNNIQNGFFIYCKDNIEKITLGFKLNGKINGICKNFDNNNYGKISLFYDGKKVKEIKNEQQMEFFFSEDNKKFLNYFLISKEELKDYLINKVKINENREELVQLFHQDNYFC